MINKNKFCGFGKNCWLVLDRVAEKDFQVYFEKMDKGNHTNVNYKFTTDDKDLLMALCDSLGVKPVKEIKKFLKGE